MEEKFYELYHKTADFAEQNALASTAKALGTIQVLMASRARTESAKAKSRAELSHALEVCSMLIDLRIDLSLEETDTLLASVLLHIYPENFPIDDPGAELADLGFSPAVCHLVETIIPGNYLSNEEQWEYYTQVQEDKLALLAVLADRGNILQQLHRFSTWNAHRYIDETKACYYPMCIYGKEHYHNLLAPISVLLEKMRSLLEVGEILLQRYEVREAELIQDIQSLREENATIKGIIAKFREN